MRGRRIDCNEVAAQIRALVIKSVGLLSDNYSVSGMVSRYLRSRRYGGIRSPCGSRARRGAGRGGGDAPYKYLRSARRLFARVIASSRTHPALLPLAAPTPVAYVGN